MKTNMSLCLLWCVLLVAAPCAVSKADPASQFGKAEIIVKDRNLATVLVRDGKPAAAIVGDAALATKLNEALKRLAGSELPVLPHSAYENAEELDRNLILIGNRDRNRTVSNLYNRHFALLDARYPGKGGSEVRSLHNPFGDKFNVILAGGSDATGDAAAVDKLIGHLEKTGGKHGELTLGFLSDVTLSPDYEVARDVKDIPLWEESAGYGNKGYFGWNSLAKNLAMLYITNDPYYKDEFMRLAFPKDEATKDELFARDDESYHDHAEPIVKVYHYRGAFMLLYWDLVDENPLFTDAERQQVTQKIYDQLVYRLTRKDHHSPYRRYDEYKPVRPHRHYGWEALLAYTAARYLHKDYPSFDTAEGLRIGKNAMEPLYTAIINGHIPLFWMGTSTELQFYYALLQGHRYVDHPALRDYARNLSLLSDLGPGNDDGNHSFTSLWTLLTGAYLAQDQALVEIVQNKKNAGVFSTKVFDLDGFRLGQSFWPAAAYPHDSIRENLGKWNFYRTAKPDAPQETELQYLSYRSTPDRSGDYLLVDTKYDHGIRETQHNFALVNATLAGVTVLRGFENTLTPFGDNLADLEQPYGSDIIASGSVGPYCWVTGFVKDFNGFDWQRTWLAKRGEYLLATDTVTAVRDLGSARLDNRFVSQSYINSMTPAGNGDFRLQLNASGDAREYTLSTSIDALAVLEAGGRVDRIGPNILTWQQDTGALKKGDVRRLVSVVRPGAPLETRSAALSAEAAALATPRPTLWNWTADGFVLREPDATLTVTGNIGQLGDGDAAATQQAAQLLASRPAPAVTAPLASVPLPVRWRQEVAPYAGVSCIFDDKAAIASHKTLRVVNLADGQILWQREVSGAIGRLAWWPQAGLLLTGCWDDKLHGWDAKGEARWTFTSEMAPEMQRFPPYYQRAAAPGIRSILPHGEMLYIGSAGTLEALDRQGQLQKRVYVQFGPLEELIPIPDSHDVLVRRLVSGDPVLHRVSPKLAVRQQGWGHGLRDYLGSFGYNQVMHQFVLFFRNGQNELRVANVFNGVQNRLVLRDADGKALNEVNFGAGKTAASVTNSCYDRPAMLDTTMRNAAIVDLDQDGTPEIAVATANGKLYVFDQQLKLLRMLTLPSGPRTLAVGDGEFFLGLHDGAIVRLAAQGDLQLVGRLSGAVLTLDRVGGQLLAGSAKGELLALALE